MTVRPLDDRVLVHPDANNEERTAGGIIIPDTAKEKPRTGKVVAVGTDEDLKEKVKVGDTILFAKYGGEEIQLDGKEHRIVQRSDILGILDR
jgi:chaperonin GroES